MAAMPELVELVSEKWLSFSRALAFKEGTPLIDKITAFAIPAIDGLRKNPEFRNVPESMLLLTVAFGIVKSGTHTKEEVESALGTKMPDSDF